MTVGRPETVEVTLAPWEVRAFVLAAREAGWRVLDHGVRADGFYFKWEVPA